MMEQQLDMMSDEGRYSAVLRHAATLVKILSDLNSEGFYSSDTVALSEFIISELSLYNTRLVTDGVDKEIIHKASYLLSSAFDDVFTRKDLYGDATKQGFLLNTHNEPGALSRFWEIADELGKGVDANTVDVAILAMSLIEIGYQGKYENHPDRFTIIRVQSEALALAVDEYLATQNDPAPAETHHRPRHSAPVWPLLSILLLVAVGLFYATELWIDAKYRHLEAMTTRLALQHHNK